MTRVGFFECVVLLAFWLGGLSAFLVGGLPWLGHVIQAFLVVSMSWVAWQLYLEVKDDVFKKIEEDKAFAEWKKRQSMKGWE